MSGRFGAVIVNYNCAPFALDAALSFLGAGGARAVIVDNHSSDGSGAVLARRIAGAEPHRCAPPPDPLAKGRPAFAELPGASAAIELIRAPRNGGFAYGCNLGLRTLASTAGCDHFLLLNPDAVLASGALEAFADRLRDPRVGLCGATVVDFEAPHRVQAFGGARLDPLWLVGCNLGVGADVADAPDRRSVESRLDYPLGAAIALRRDYLARAGFLDERYFLYYEEADWALAGGPALRPAWATEAVVYHRYGAASLSRRSAPGRASARSPLADRHMARSRVLFARKWRAWLAPLALASALLQSALRLARGRPENAEAILAGAFAPGL
jgi:hypothetical protein